MHVSLTDPLPSGAMSEGEWSAELGGSERWALLEPMMRQAIKSVTLGSSRTALIKTMAAHLSARQGQLELAQSSWSQSEPSESWTRNLGVRARVDCLRALMWESSAEAFAAADDLARELGAAALAKRRSWGPLPSEGSLACAYATELALELSRAPENAKATLDLAERWIERLSEWGIAEWREPAIAALSAAKGGAKVKRPSPEAVRAITRGACKMARRAAALNQGEELGFEKAAGLDVGLKMAELALSSSNDSAARYGALTPEAAELIEEVWALAAREASLEAEAGSWLSRLLLSLRCAPEDAGLSLALAQTAARLGALRPDVFERMAASPFSELAPALSNPSPGINLWIRALLAEGMSPNALNERGESLLCLANERAKCFADQARVDEMALCVAELLQGGANPAFIVPQLDPLESAHPAFKSLIAAATERAVLESAAAAPLSGRSAKLGI